LENVTLSIALAVSALVLCLPPIYGLIVYVAALAWYPPYLTVQLGTIDFCVTRIVILALYAKIFLGTNLSRRFKFNWLDALAITYFVAQIISNAFTDSMMKLLENRAGAAFDMLLPYFIVRMVVTDKKKYLTLLKGILIIAAPLAIVGLYQCLTSHNPVGFMMKYTAWSSTSRGHFQSGYIPRARRGFFRANVTFSVSIMFGLFFAMLGPACVGLLRNINKNRIYYIVAIILMAVGIFSSMSSGPMLAGLLAVSFIAFHRYRKYWKMTLAAVILMCGTVEITSNRHFYDILGGFTISPGTAWYRSRLIEVALFEGGMSGHWVAGFGNDADPGWSSRIDGRAHTDVVNHYLLVLVRYGLIGLVPFLAMNIMAIKKLIDGYKKSILKSDKWLIWCLSAGFFGLAGAMMSVSLFGQPTTVYYMMIGFTGVLPANITRIKHQNCNRSDYSGGSSDMF